MLRDVQSEPHHGAFLPCSRSLTPHRHPSVATRRWRGRISRSVSRRHHVTGRFVAASVVREAMRHDAARSGCAPPPVPRALPDRRGRPAGHLRGRAGRLAGPADGDRRDRGPSAERDQQHARGVRGQRGDRCADRRGPLARRPTSRAPTRARSCSGRTRRRSSCISRGRSDARSVPATRSSSRSSTTTRTSGRGCWRPRTPAPPSAGSTSATTTSRSTSTRSTRR